MVSLIYSELLKQYNEILISTSRGFDTKHEFLESWVPSDDINQSISDLISAAIDYKIFELEIDLSKDEISDFNLEKLRIKLIDSGTIDLTDKKIKFCSTKNND